PMTLTHKRPTRAGFTLTEVMIAMALTLGMMVILTQAFRLSTDFVRSANSTKVLMGHLNGVESAVRQDMNAWNFLDEDAKPNLGRRRSDQWMHTLTVGGQQWTPPRGGYFKIYSPPTTWDPANNPDPEGFYITSATNHNVQFTAILPGGNESNLFTVNSP